MALSLKHKRVAEAMTSGAFDTHWQAYQSVYSRASYNTARSAVAAIASHSEFQDYKEKLEAENRERSRRSKDDQLKWLASIIETPINEVGADHPLAQEISYNKDGDLIVKMPAKMEAHKQLSQMCGWNAPKEIDHRFSNLSEAVAAIVGEPDEVSE